MKNYSVSTHAYKSKHMREEEVQGKISKHVREGFQERFISMEERDGSGSTRAHSGIFGHPGAQTWV